MEDMASSYLPPIEGVTTLTTAERVAILDALFEPSTALHTLSLDLLHTKKFDSYDDLISTVRLQLITLVDSTSTSDKEWLDKILGAHPRLGDKKLESSQSKTEQAQLNKGGEYEAALLRELNEHYERAFPGLKYVVFVNGRPRSVIMENMKVRIARGDIYLERLEAINAMCEIAADRTIKLQPRLSGTNPTATSIV